MNIPFAKYQATGNDFLVVLAQDLGSGLGNTSSGRPRLASFARAILARHTGVGADGLLLVSPPAAPGHHLNVRVLNADGSEAETSGNGIRCAAAWFLDHGRVSRKGARVRTGTGAAPSILKFETLAGVKTVTHLGRRGGDRLFRVNMGKPSLRPAEIPFTGPGAKTPVKAYPLRVSAGAQEVTVISIGNPHCSVFVANFADLDWRALGREIEHHSLFPRRTNVEFVRVLSRREIEVRFWERGVGETASSGTGSSAAAVAAALNELTGRKVQVKARGGTLEVNWGGSGSVYLIGPARVVSSGCCEYRESSAAEPL
jgi:diaminopimelate epimerase